MVWAISKQSTVFRASHVEALAEVWNTLGINVRRSHSEALVQVTQEAALVVIQS